MKTHLQALAAFFLLILLIFAHNSLGSTIETQDCPSVFESLIPHEKPILEPQLEITSVELQESVSKGINQVIEFDFIRSLAQTMGIRVWLFGGTASSFLHYVHWDLAAKKGVLPLQTDRFDYDFTNIFRSTQDIDIVIDGTAEDAQLFEERIAYQFPYFIGNKANQWEVRTLRSRIKEPGSPGYKEALLDDSDFHNQNTDSHSVGMIELTSTPGEPRIRDLKNWDQPKSIFLEDTLHHRISFFRSNQHFSTSRAQAGENPEILSVIRLLVKAFQFQLNFSDQTFSEINKISKEFNPEEITHPIAIRRIQDTAKKLILHAVNLEYAFNTLDQLGLRNKLILMGNIKSREDFSWWLNREPLRSKPIGLGDGSTAKELKLEIVTHETLNLAALESITRAHSGEPNVLISRLKAIGEIAVYGDGFYTLRGRDSYNTTGITVRFSVHPEARQGSDFTIHDNGIIVFKNKNALKVIPESLTYHLHDILRIAETDDHLWVQHSDKGLLEKQLRRFNFVKIMKELNPLIQSGSSSDLDQANRILVALCHPKVSHLISHDVILSVIKDFVAQVVNNPKILNGESSSKYIQIIQDLIHSTHSKNSIFKNKRDFIDLIAITRSNQELRSLFTSNYFGSRLDPARKLAEKILDRPDISEKIASNLIQQIEKMYSIKYKTKILDISELFKAYSFFEKTQIEPELSEQLLYLYDPSSFNSEINLEKAIYLLLDSKSVLFQNHGLKLLDDAPFRSKLSPRLFRQIIRLQNKKFHFKRFFQAATQWMKSISVNPELKAIFLLIHFGTPQFEIYRDLLPHSQVPKVTRKLAQDSNLGVFEQLGQKEALDHAKIESFLFIPHIFPKNGKKITIGNSDQSLLNSSWKDFYRHEITMTRSFEIQATPVTQLQWSLIMGENPSYFKKNSKWVQIGRQQISMNPNRPVEQVSWEEAQIFIDRLSKLDPDYDYRLPTEAEWEYAARGGTDTLFSFGNDLTHVSEYAWHAGNSNQETHDVASLRPNPSGLFDVHGNVWEWVQDWYSEIPESKLNPIDPEGPPFGKHRVVRGDAYLNQPNDGHRSSFREKQLPISHHSSIGFRLVRVPKKTTPSGTTHLNSRTMKS